jgi:hypothetical protein
MVPVGPDGIPGGTSTVFSTSVPWIFVTESTASAGFGALGGPEVTGVSLPRESFMRVISF